MCFCRALRRTPARNAPFPQHAEAPITFVYDNTQDVADLFDLKTFGHFYTRLSNPTVAAFEGKMCMLEGGAGALACASGQSATSLAIMNICQAGQHVVAASTLGPFTCCILRCVEKIRQPHVFSYKS